jgi:hypothetical protein
MIVLALLYQRACWASVMLLRQSSVCVHRNADFLRHGTTYGHPQCECGALFTLCVLEFTACVWCRIIRRVWMWCRIIHHSSAGKRVMSYEVYSLGACVYGVPLCMLSFSFALLC